MIRWRYCLLLVMLLLLPVRTETEDEDDEEDNTKPEDDNDDNDIEADDEDDATEKPESKGSGGRIRGTTRSQSAISRTPLRRPLECYVCAYKVETQLKSCLDPTKHRVHTMTCHSADEKCFTSVTSKGNNYESIMRGCRSTCISSPEVTCCEMNRCNNQAYAMPVIAPRVRFVQASKSATSKVMPQTVLFFVTVLLVLQTVVKVAIV